MKILGLSAYYHDSAAALLVDGRVAAAAQEERFSRIKHDPSYPRQAIDACLRTAGVRGRDLDAVAFFEKPLVKLGRALDTTMAVAPRGLTRFARAMPSWFTDKLRFEQTLHKQLDFDGPFFYASHHESHAASAFFASPFEDAATLTIDGVGEWTTNAIGHGAGNRLRMLQELRFPHSLGLLYSAFTQYLGFRVNEGEYKVMGLAPYGEPRFVQPILDHLLDLRDDGSYQLNLQAFAFLHAESTIGPRFEAIFGQPARQPDSPLASFHMDVARSIQAVTEEVMLRQARYAKQVTGASKLCLAGGVALNCVGNGRVLREGPFDDLWVQPAAGDAGGALGAALVVWHHVYDAPRSSEAGDTMRGAYLGPKLDADSIPEALQAHNLTSEPLPQPELLRRTAALLAEGKVVGWCQGRMEFGPRALGNRSILADPRRMDMQSRVNQAIKFREGFRPFAPMVLAEHAPRWFDLGGSSPYMLLVTQVAAAQQREVDASITGLDRLQAPRSTIPAVTHVDGSARVQTVDGAHNPRIHGLLTAFHDATGCPVLLNTSFNLRDEPIVATPMHACRTFLASGMDALVLGDHLVLRPEGRPPTGAVPQPTPAPRVVDDAFLRTFGVGGGIILLALAALQTWRGHPAFLVVAVPALALLLPGLIAPRRLERVEGVAARFAHALGAFNGRLLLGLLHLAMITPLGLLRRALAGDPLAPTSTPIQGHWLPIDPASQDSERYRRLF